MTGDMTELLCAEPGCGRWAAAIPGTAWHYGWCVRHLALGRAVQGSAFVTRENAPEPPVSPSEPLGAGSEADAPETGFSPSQSPGAASPGTWIVGTPAPKRKAPWAASPGLTYEGAVLRTGPDGVTVVEARHCGHRHTRRDPALRCAAKLAHSLNQAT